MKKKLLIAIGIICLGIFYSCEKSNDLVDLKTEHQKKNSKVPDVYSENGYLVFKSQATFDSIRYSIENLDNLAFQTWEKQLNFTSAKTIKDRVEEEALKLTTDSESASFKEKYNDLFKINDDLDIEYCFYSQGLDQILNIEGIVKIGTSLYKFTESKEYISLNGDSDELIQISSGLKSGIEPSKNIVIFDPSSAIKKLKSTDVLDEGIKTVGTRRLIWSVEKYVFSTISNFNPYTGETTYSAGYELNLIMNQEKYRGTFSKKWRNNEAAYDLENQYIDWSELGVSPTPGYTGAFDDQHISTTRKTVRQHYISRQYYSTKEIYRDFALRDFRVTFWSSGIGDGNKITVNL